MARSPLIEKESSQQSGTTVEHFRNPTNERMASAMTQYVVDYKQFGSYIPDNKKKTLVEATQGQGRTTQSTNSSGKSACFGPSYYVELGGSPDGSGRF